MCGLEVEWGRLLWSLHKKYAPYESNLNINIVDNYKLKNLYLYHFSI